MNPDLDLMASTDHLHCTLKKTPLRLKFINPPIAMFLYPPKMTPISPIPFLKKAQATRPQSLLELMKYQTRSYFWHNQKSRRRVGVRMMTVRRAKVLTRSTGNDSHEGCKREPEIPIQETRR